jgi:metal-responsive CopG/Arc/MetJ family transcriptional regulator
MRTVQMTLDDELVVRVDRIVSRLGTTRSAFTRQALRAAIEHLHLVELENKHREGYRSQPVLEGEFDV